MRILTFVFLALTLLIGVWTIRGVIALAQTDGNDNNVAMMDDCLPGDPGWTPTGGCALKLHQGDVPTAEFGALLVSPLYGGGGALVGHPSWRNEPSHVTVNNGKTVRVTNKGGRAHTFTRVAQFGGGFVDDLNIGLAPAPECLPPAGPAGIIPPGGATAVSGLTSGLNRYQCCIHPWMRATIRVQ